MKFIKTKELKSGDKVCLDYTHITTNINYIKNESCTEQHVVDYHAFIEASRNKIFTIDKAYESRNDLFQLKGNSRWLFHFSDLKKIVN